MTKSLMSVLMGIEATITDKFNYQNMFLYVIVGIMTCRIKMVVKQHFFQ